MHIATLRSGGWLEPGRTPAPRVFRMYEEQGHTGGMKEFFTESMIIATGSPRISSDRITTNDKKRAAAAAAAV